MSVTQALIVQSPANQPRLLNEGLSSQYNPLVSAGYLRPWFADGISQTLAGAAGGGTAKFTYEMRPQADDSTVFVAFTEVWVSTNEVTAGTGVALQPATADWERPMLKKNLIDNQVEPDLVVQIVSPDAPYYLGEGRARDTLEVQIEFTLNTDGKTYRSYSAGWISDRPFLIPRSFTP